MRKFKYEAPLEELSVEKVNEFLTGIENGTLKSHLRSAEPPLEQSGNVIEVVGKQFDEIVMDPSKDVLIQLYAPNSVECQNIKSIWT